MTDLDLTAILAAVRSECLRLGHGAWPGLAALLDAALPDPMDPVALLPIAVGVGCGAAPERLAPAVAPVLLAGVAFRILDDCADLDNPSALSERIGVGRAANAAAALSVVAARGIAVLDLPEDRRAHVSRAFSDAYLEVCHGQEQDLARPPRSLAGYRDVVALKTVAAYRFAALSGALAAGAAPAQSDAAIACGEQLGWMIQTLDDIEALWFPDGPDDLSQGRWTLPVLTALESGDLRVAALRRLLAARAVDRLTVCALLDDLGVRARLMHDAVDRRDAALAALDALPDPRGRAILETWLDWLLRDGQRLLEQPAAE